jgi:LuxR family maltose regulon positive regulatory protein
MKHRPSWQCHQHVIDQLLSNVGMLSVIHAPAGFGKTFLLRDLMLQIRQRGGGFASEIRTDRLEQKQWILLDEPQAEAVSAAALAQALDAACACHAGVVIATRRLDRLPTARLRAEGRAIWLGPRQIGAPTRIVRNLLRAVVDGQQADRLAALVDGWSAAAQFLIDYGHEKGACFDEHGEFLTASGFSAYIDQEILADIPEDWLSALRASSALSSVNRVLLDSVCPHEDLGRHLSSLRCAMPGLLEERDGETYLNPLLRLHMVRQFDQLPRATRVAMLDRASRHIAGTGRMLEAAQLAMRIEDPATIIDFVRRSNGLRLWVIAGADVLRAIVAKAELGGVADDPRVKLLKCVVRMKDGEIDAAERLFREVEMGTVADPGIRQDAAAVRLAFLVYGCRPATLEEITDCRQSILRSGDDPAWQTMVLSMQCILHLQRGDLDKATADIVEAVMHARAAGSDYSILFLHIHSATVALARGELARARSLLAVARREWRRKFPADMGVQTVLDVLTANLEFEAGRLSSARMHIRRSTHRMPHVEAWFDIYAAAYEPLARLLVPDVGLASTVATLRLQQDALRARGLQRIASLVGALAVCLSGEARLQGASGPSLQPLPPPAVPPEMMTWQEREIFGFASAYQQLERGERHVAVRQLQDLLSFADQRDLKRTALRAQLLLVAALDGRSDQEADAVFSSALEAGASSGMSRCFIEFGGMAVRRRVLRRVAELRTEQCLDSNMVKLVRNLGRWVGTSSSNTATVFTARELDVLFALDQGGPDKLIGRRLGVSEHAVRYHLKNIYRKLRVHDRVEALSRARELGQLH